MAVFCSFTDITCPGETIFNCIAPSRTGGGPAKLRLDRVRFREYIGIARQGVRQWRGQSVSKSSMERLYGLNDLSRALKMGSGPISNPRGCRPKYRIGTDD